MNRKLLLAILLILLLPVGQIQNILKKTVHVTVYSLVPSQTDSTPYELADGTIVKTKNYGKLRYCAVSRDLLKRNGGILKFNDFIFLDLPDKKLSGWWKVKDVMNKRWKNRVDLLVNRNTYPYSFRNAELMKV